MSYSYGSVNNICTVDPSQLWNYRRYGNLDNGADFPVSLVKYCSQLAFCFLWGMDCYAEDDHLPSRSDKTMVADLLLASIRHHTADQLSIEGLNTLECLLTVAGRCEASLNHSTYMGLKAFVDHVVNENYCAFMVSRNERVLIFLCDDEYSRDSGVAVRHVNKF